MMRILLDECLPVRLKRNLPGHDVQTVSENGWTGIKNGELLRLISESRKFNVFLTMDKNLPHQHQIGPLPFAVVVLRAASNRFEDTYPLMPEVSRRLNEFQAGQTYIVTLLDS